jgi:magnesium/cobalt transport protein CorA
MAEETIVYWLTPLGFEQHGIHDLPNLLARTGGFAWVDIPVCDEQASVLLSEVFRFHALAVRDCVEPSPVPKVHAYADHVFVALHVPYTAGRGEVHYVEFNQFVGSRYLVTVHESPEAGVRPEATLSETRAVRERLHAGRFLPASSFELSYAVVTALARGMEGVVWSLASRVRNLERRVLEATTHPRQSEATVEELFRVRHELLTVETMANENRVVYARIVALARFVPPEGRPFIEDQQDQFDRVSAMCAGQSRFLQEILDFYQTRVAGELNAFVKRLTALGTMLVLATLIAGIYGMNFEHMPELGWRLGYPMALGTMLVSSAVLGWWFHRKGWL